MYDEFSLPDIEMLNIIQNARKFDFSFGENVELLKYLFEAKKLEIKFENRQKIIDIFEILEKLKENSQLSKS